MPVSDTLADLMTRIRNASTAGHRYVDVPFSSVSENVARVLKEQKFIEHYLVKHESGIGTIRIFLRYTEGTKPMIQGIRKISTPGRRKYIGYQEIPRVLDGLGISILSTSQGVLAGQEARRRKVGGELICYVW